MDIERSAEIVAPPEKMWAAMTDVQRYPDAESLKQRRETWR
jgi:hypothetical protein